VDQQDTWLDQCQGAGRIFFDSVLQILPGMAADDDFVKTFMRQLEELKHEVGAPELLFAMHMNRNRDARAFGSVSSSKQRRTPGSFLHAAGVVAACRVAASLLVHLWMHT